LGKYRTWLLIILGLVLLVFVACGGGSSSTRSQGEKGDVYVTMTDAATDEYNAVYVTVAELQAFNKEVGWRTIASPNETVNLLELVNGVQKGLGQAKIDTGAYTQLRLILNETPDNGLNILNENHPFGNYIIDTENKYHRLKIPSAYRTGINIDHGFSLQPDKAIELVLDFDVSKSVVRAGQKVMSLLKPMIKVLDLNECSYVLGTIRDGNGYPLEGALVSAQVYNPDAMEIRDRMVVQTSTLTNEQGQYTIFLPQGTYNIVAYKEEYNEGGQKVLLRPNTSISRDFSLSPAFTGSLSGEVLLNGAGEDEHVNISIRRKTGILSGKGEEWIEIKSVPVANFGDYSILLPEGTYTVVAFNHDRPTQTHEIIVEPDRSSTLDLTF
jgi:hypothetical protein